ncbi:hypothetical protein EPIR_2981 [Erwinia piriflorinigrans CFBP 5888]|uniref:Uncharacterized protein n=1 Tax=Erwinia piriflorinigrans CFBP 5888 TaxID=1161919 RepID=V5ZBM7_9GAMM|nr:hypothetical protein EPIR_2981 [Erwinia piriflorinigrans CFBP 5888]
MHNDGSPAWHQSDRIGKPMILPGSENFFTPPLDAELPGPILSGIQE